MLDSARIHAGQRPGSRGFRRTRGAVLQPPGCNPRAGGSQGLALVAACLLATAACGVDPQDPAEGPPEGIASAQQGLSSISCAESTDTGYKQGSAFTIKVVTVDGKKVEQATANAYYVMAQAAAAAGVNLKVVSGFRTMSEQTYLYNCYVNCSCNSCNLAAKPGYSNHQSGHALDLNTSSSGVYSWLLANGGKYGFTKTVPSESWHWEWWGGGPGGGPCGTCKPSCSGSKIIGTDCGQGDCATYGATCVDDSKGVRCVSVFCPALGTKKVCVNDKIIGDCSDGAISTGDCSVYGAYCSTAGSASARCVSVFCVKSASDAPKAHAICLPDGRLAQCTDEGGLKDAQTCAAGTSCVQDPTAGAACVAPTSPADDASVAPAGDAEGAGQLDAGAADAVGSDAQGSWESGVPPLQAGGQSAATLEGSCSVGGAAANWPAALALLALLLGLRRPVRRGGVRLDVDVDVDG